MAGKERKGGENCSSFESASFHPTCLPAISPPPPWRPFDPSFPPSSEKRNQRFRNREDNGACHSAILPAARFLLFFAHVMPSFLFSFISHRGVQSQFGPPTFLLRSPAAVTAPIKRGGGESEARRCGGGDTRGSKAPMNNL